MPDRFIINGLGRKVQARHPNRPANSRELLGLLGHHADTPPELLLYGKDTLQNDWTLIGSAAYEAAASPAVVEMMSDVVVLDAQNEGAYATIAAGSNPGLPAGAYHLRVRAKDSNQVADDLGMKVRNHTDANDILAQTPRTLASTYGIREALFSIRAADAGDEIRLTFEKRTATANTIRIDYASLHPVSARSRPWGRAPEGGRKVLSYSGGNVSAHTVYDAASGGNTIETATYAYVGSDLDYIDYTRDGLTVRQSFVYVSGDLTEEKWGIPA